MSEQGGHLGEVWATGTNSFGELGIGYNSTAAYTWTKTNAYNVSAIAAGRNHSLCLADGNIWSTGLNNYGQLGLGDRWNRYNFTQTAAASCILIAAGDYHSLTLCRIGWSVWSTGYNGYGQLGMRTSNPTVWNICP
jgi:alpha-tubulin suppressor-like RCC1 family protein